MQVFPQCFVGSHRSCVIAVTIPPIFTRERNYIFALKKSQLSDLPLKCFDCAVPTFLAKQFPHRPARAKPLLFHTTKDSRKPWLGNTSHDTELGSARWFTAGNQGLDQPRRKHLNEFAGIVFNVWRLKLVQSLRRPYSLERGDKNNVQKLFWY